jgi:hypothetical protein
MDVSDPAPLTVVTLHHLGDGQGDQLTVGQFGSAATTGAGRDDMVIDQHIKCRQEGVQIVRHRLILNALLSCPDTGAHFT